MALLASTGMAPDALTGLKVLMPHEAIGLLALRPPAPAEGTGLLPRLCVEPAACPCPVGLVLPEMEAGE